MPTNLERHVSNTRSARRSIKPAAKRPSDDDSSSSDSDGPGAVEEDFFTPPPREPTPRIVSQDQEAATSMLKQTSSANVGVMARQTTAMSVSSPADRSSPVHPQHPPQRQQQQQQQQQHDVEPHQHNAMAARQPISEKDLVEKSVMRNCQYLGEVTQIPMTFNINNRSRLLSVIDSSRRQGRLPWTPHNKHNIRLAFSAKDLRLLDQRGQAVIVRLPLHTVAALSYFHDDAQHLVALHSGSESDRTRGVLHVFHFSSQEAAEEMCTIVSKCFELLYTDATMAMLDLSITGDGAANKQGTRSSLPRQASADQFYPNISSSLISDLHDVQRIAVPEEKASGPAPQLRGSIMRQSSHDNMGVQQQTSSQSNGPAVASPPAMLPPPPAAAPQTSTDGGAAATSAPAPMNNMAPSSAHPLPPPSSRPALVQAIGHSKRGRQTPGAGLVAVYDSEDESDHDTRPPKTGPAVGEQQQADAKQQQQKEINEAAEAAAVVQSYMKVMHKIVNSEELREFASLVRNYRDSLPIDDFCQKLGVLFGPERKFMLPGMRAFIPASDLFFFEEFLQKENAAQLKIPSSLREG